MSMAFRNMAQVDEDFYMVDPKDFKTKSIERLVAPFIKLVSLIKLCYPHKFHSYLFLNNFLGNGLNRSLL